MANVFISYARKDEPRAEKVAAALRSRGYQVWRDNELPAHRAYADVIEERLKWADAVIVLWSSDAVKSQWVRAEADAARSAAKLVQVTLDGTIPPMPFNQIQCAELKDWDGNDQSAGWHKLEGSVEALAGSSGDGGKQRDATRAVSVCVLPFANMSGDSEQEYFSDGISEDITTDLSKVSALEVIARNTAFQFKGHSVDVCDVARKLSVSHVLEGSVRKAANRVRITAQLIDGKSGGHIWADRYDRDLDDIFVIQDEISKAIVDALKVKLLPQEKEAIENRGTTNVDAYNLYLMARQYWMTGNWGDVRQVEIVIRICKKAVEIDPDYAKAWGLLALLQSILRYTFGTTNDAGVAAAERALALDPTIAEAYCVTARHLFEAGEIQKSDEAITMALDLEPNSWEVNREAGRLFYLERRMDEAVRHYEKAVAVDETDFHTWGMLSSAYEALGNREGVLHAAKMMVSQSERVVASDPTNGAALGIGAGGLAILGERDRVKQWIDRALLISPDNQIMRYNFACISALYLNDPDGAIRLLEPIFESGLLILFKNAFTDPDLDSLRGDPRFERLLELAKQRMLAAGDVPPSDTRVT